MPGIYERRPEPSHRYIAFTDPSGGSSDAMTLAIAHKEGDTAILDAVREVRPPFSPEAVVDEFATLLRAFRVTRVYGDFYAGQWPGDRFRAAGINYVTADRTKSQLFLDLVPLLNSRSIDLLDNERLMSQLTGLERRTTRGGRDLIGHRPGSHDDLANAVAGAVVLAADSKLRSAGDWREIRVEGLGGYSPFTGAYTG
jgi:hypothetical protein